MSIVIRSFLVFSAALGLTHAQTNILATSSSGQSSIGFHAAMVSFVPSNANSAEDAVKSAAISVAENHAITAAAARTIPIPVVGPYIAGPVVNKIMKTFHPDKPITGFNVAFLPGLSAATIIQRGEASFTIPAQALQGGNPALVRVKISSKDSSRLVRSVHASVKIKNSKINPMASDTKVLGIDEDTIACHQEIRNGDIILTPNSALAIGEYAVVILPTQQDTIPVAGSWVWDFRVM
ncbi:MAG: hypothetical protein WDO73_26335 [Ignavibacteriota bacterium]